MTYFKSHFYRISILIVFIIFSGCNKPINTTKTIKIGLGHSANHSFTKAFEIFGKQFEEETNGRYKVKIFHSSQLGSESVMQEMLTIGSLDMTITGLLNTYDPMFALFEMPYLYRDRAHAFNVNTGEIIDELGKPLTKKGIHILSFYENGFRQITNSKKPIESLNDMKGLMIRTPENQAQIKTIAALGGVPTPMSFSELYTALLQGVVDGQENPLQNIWYTRLYEAQSYLSFTNHIYNAAYILISERVWQDLPENDRILLKKCIKNSTAWQLEYMETLDKELMQKLKNEGVEFSYPDIEEFRKACEAAYEEIYKELGPEAEDIITRIRKAN